MSSRSSSSKTGPEAQARKTGATALVEVKQLQGEL